MTYVRPRRGHAGIRGLRFRVPAPMILALLLSAVVPLRPARGYIVEVSEYGIDTVWHGLRQSPPNPLQFAYNVGGSNRLGGPLQGNHALQEALDRAFGAWSDIPTATVRFQPMQLTSSQNMGYDGSNLVIFTSVNPENFGGVDGPYIIGLTTTSYDPLSGEMVDADIQFNDTSPYFHLTLTGRTGADVPGNPSAMYVNLEDVATHEVGHALGLDHCGLINATMYFAAAPLSARLSPDDAAGISSLYPAAGFQSSHGTLQGTVTRGLGVFGAHVVAVDARDGNPAVSALTDTTGQYRMEGLKPGPYFVMAEALKPNALGIYHRDISTQINTSILQRAPGSPTVIDVKAGDSIQVPDIDVSQRFINPDAPTTPATAVALPVPGAAIRSLPYGSNSHPQDFYSIRIEGSTKIVFNVTSYRIWVPLDPVLELYDGSMNLVAGPSTDLSVNPPTNLDDRLTWTPPPETSGTFFLKVRTRAAPAALFPDTRTVKTSSSLYLLSVREEKDNKAPRILIEAAARTLESDESRPENPVILELPLAGAGKDTEDAADQLRWSVAGVPEDLVSVDETALGATPPVLRLRLVDHASGAGTLDLVLSDTEGGQSSAAISLTIHPIDDPPAIALETTPGRLDLPLKPQRLVLDASGTTGGAPGDRAEALDPLLYRWTQTAGPALPLPQDADLRRIQLSPRAAGLYRFRLDVGQVGADGISVDASHATSQEVSFSIENSRPRAGPVPNQVVNVGQEAIIDARLSADANDNLEDLAFGLAPIGGNPGTLSITPLEHGVFRVVTEPIAGTYRAILTVTDSGQLDESGNRTSPLEDRTEVVIHIRDASIIPTMDAGSDRVIAAGSVVELSGSMMEEASADWVYSWTSDQTNPAPVVVSDPYAKNAQFVAPQVPGRYRLSLRAFDPSSAIQGPADTVTVTVIDPIHGDGQVPGARVELLTYDDVNGDRVVDPWEAMILTAARSRDPAGRRLDYEWKVNLGPPLDLGSGATPLLIPVTQGTLELEVIALSAGRSSAPVRLRLDVGKTASPPLPVTLRQASSTLTFGSPTVRFTIAEPPSAPDPITMECAPADPSSVRCWFWEQVEGPLTPLTIQGGKASFVPRGLGVHEFRIRALRDSGHIEEQTVRIVIETSRNRVPYAAVESANIDSQAGQRVSLNGSGSQSSASLLAADDLIFHWVQTAGVPVVLDGDEGATPSFLAKLPGTYEFRLRVSSRENGLTSAWAEEPVQIEVESLPERASEDMITVETSVSSGSSGGCHAGDGAGGSVGLPWFLMPWFYGIILGTRRRKSAWKPVGLLRLGPRLGKFERLPEPPIPLSLHPMVQKF